MKQALSYMILGVLVIIGGITYNQHRLIPEFLYYVFGGVSIIFGIYKLLASAADSDEG